MLEILNYAYDMIEVQELLHSVSHKSRSFMTKEIALIKRLVISQKKEVKSHRI
jgi:hypothetical protein